MILICRQLWLLMSLLPLFAQAYTGVTVVLTEQSQANQVFVDALKNEISRANGNVLRLSVQMLKPHSKLVVAENSELVIALGEQALEAAAKLSHTTPVLGVQVTMPVLEEIKIKSRRSDSTISAITLYQPNERVINLIENLFLQHPKKVGMLVGQNSQFHGEQLKTYAFTKGIFLDLSLINFKEDLIDKLSKLLMKTEVILTFPDPETFNRETAASVLLTTYKYKKPVVGSSQLSIKAGALAAVYSGGQDLAKQAAEIAIKGQTSSIALPQPVPPKYFSVGVNKRVANLLNIKVMDESLLYKKMLEAESLS